MRTLVAYAVALSVVALVLAFKVDTANHRIAALEQQLAGTSHAPIAAAVASQAPRTFTSSRGYVLATGDLDRIDADHTAEKAAAELEYYVKKSDHRR